MAGKSPEEQIGVPLPEREEPEAEAIQVEEQEDRPEWLPEKFSDPSEFVSSYRNLEAELTQRANDQRRLEAQVDQLGNLIENLSADQRQPQQQQPNVDGVREQLMAAYESDPIGTIAMLSQQYSNQTFDQRMQQMQQQAQPYQQAQVDQQNQMLAITVDGMMTQRHEDWGELKETIAHQIESDPYLLPEQVIQAGPEATMRALERVYTQVKAQQIMESGGRNGGDAAQMKMQAQGLSGTGGRPGQPTDAERDADAIVAAAKNLSYSGFRSGGR